MMISPSSSPSHQRPHAIFHCTPVLVPACTPNPGSPARQPGASAPTLQELCWRVLKTHVTVDNVLELMHLVEQLNFPAPLSIHDHCIKYATDAYLLLRERKGQEHLQQYLSPEMLAHLEAVVEEREKCVASLKDVLGRVVDRPPAPDSSVVEQPSVGGAPHSYKYEALVSGVQWPPDVDPSCRERFMSHEEFQRLFNISYEQYCSLPAWKQKVYKQEHKLF